MKIRLVAILLVLLTPLVAWPAIDTFEGEELTSSSTIEGVSTTDTVEGQEITQSLFTCAGTETFCEDWNSCTSDAEPASCDETWSASGVDEWLVKDTYGYTGAAGDKALYFNSATTTDTQSVANLGINTDSSFTAYIDFIILSGSNTDQIRIEIRDNALNVVIRIQISMTSDTVFKVEDLTNAPATNGIATGCAEGTWYTLVLSDVKVAAADTHDVEVLTKSTGASKGSLNDTANYSDLANVDEFFFDGVNDAVGFVVDRVVLD